MIVYMNDLVVQLSQLRSGCSVGRMPVAGAVYDDDICVMSATANLFIIAVSHTGIPGVKEKNKQTQKQQKTKTNP